MSGSQHSSPDWYRVAETQPVLAPDVRIVRHVYLGRPWYILANATGTKVHRLTPAAYAVAGRLDGRQTVARILDDLAASLGAEAPTQDEVVRLLSQLHQGDLLEMGDTPLLDDLLERRDKERGQFWKKLLLNPLASTIPLVDPTPVLTPLVAAMRVLPGVIWWLIVLAILTVALALLPVHWAALTDRGLEGFLDLQNLALIALIYPVVKAVHELGHGVVTRTRGGEVHEMGVMFVAFYPIPYVEASAALTFPSKWDRAAVAAAGVAVELVIAALCFFLWIGAEPGVLRTILFNTMVISGLSTLLINGNPLLKFDGYHVMCDLIEIPNLSKRGNDWWGEILRVHLLGTDERRRDRAIVTGWERVWLFAYPPAALVYRIFISLTIALFVATTYMAVGVVLAVWSLTLMLIWPGLKTAHKALTDPRIRLAGGRAVAGAVGAVAILVGVIFALPLPHHAVVQGVTWLPDEAVLRAPDTGEVRQVAARHGDRVQAGAALFTLTSPELEAEAARRTARRDRLRAELAAAQVSDRARAASLRAQVAEAEDSAQTARDRLTALSINAAVPGRLNLPEPTSPLGQLYTRGSVLGHILPDAAPVIRVAVPQPLVQPLRDELRTVSIRFAHRPEETRAARVLREVPAGADRLPSSVLSLDGGGPFATVPGGNDPLTSVERLFQLDLALAQPDQMATPLPYGLRVYARLSFAPKPLGLRAARAIRRAFLGAFDV